MVSDEQLFAWLDGELSAEEEKKVAAEVAADPRLSEMAEQHRAMQARLKRAFDPILDQTVPPRLIAEIDKSSNVIDLAPRSRPASAWRPAQWAAIAASLAVGVSVGTMIPRENKAPVEIGDGKIYAAAELGRTLDAELASAPTNAPIRIGLTFRDHSGSICRTFTEAGASGLACRDGNRWRMHGLFTSSEGQEGAYRMAAGMDPTLAALVDSTIAGEPFDAAQERAARDKNWR
jgi:hypothetical protein